MKIGIDLDGTISQLALYNPSLELPWWLFVFLLPLVPLARPNRVVVERLREIERCGDEVIIVSARPPWITSLTKKWLRLHGIPFTRIFCVGFGKGTWRRKLEVIKKEGIERFFDNDERLVRLLNGQSVKATTSLE